MRFELASEIPGWVFTEEPLSPVVLEILATTNLVNGVFFSETGSRVTAFAAEWRANSGRSMSVVQHTPDICWVGAGWKPVAAGQPERVVLEISGEEVPFECRVFESPDGRRREFVIWCTVLGGSVLQEARRWRVEEDSSAASRTRIDWAGRRLASGQFLSNLASRRSGVGEKQFVRLSVGLTGDIEAASGALSSFAASWLSVVH